MSIIQFTVKTLGGALNPSTGPVEEIRVSRDETAKVVMTGFIGAGREKNAEGKYESTGFGRLPVKAAIVGEGGKQRYYLDIAGGLRGVLFKNNKKNGDNDPDYTGNIEVGEQVYPLFGRKIDSDNGSFVSLNSGEAEAKGARGGRSNSSSSQDDGQYSSRQEIPF